MILPIAFFSLYFPVSASALTPIGYLGSAVSFGVLASTPNVTNTGVTSITGTAGSDVGISPAAAIVTGELSLPELFTQVMPRR